MQTKLSQTQEDCARTNRKIASDTAVWYFNEYLDTDISEIEQINKTADIDPKEAKFAPEVWVALLSEAIASFNQGLEDIIEPEDRHASLNQADSYNMAIDLVGEEAFRTIAFLVAAQGTRRPVDIYAQASTVYTTALNELHSGVKDSGKLRQYAKQIEDLSKTPGLDQETARAIAGFAAELTNYSNEFAASGGPTQGGSLPTGISIQGRRRQTVLV